MAMHFIGCRAGILFHHSACASGSVATHFTTTLIRNLANKMGLPRVYFDMTADNQPLGRIIMEVSVFVDFNCVKRCE